MHPNDWARAQLLKNGQAEYLLGSPLNTPGQTLWGLPVVDTLAMDEDEFLVGPFGVAAQIFDRMDAEVLISSEDRDNFIKNMLTVRAEQRLALVVRRPSAFVTGGFGPIESAGTE